MSMNSTDISNTTDGASKTNSRTNQHLPTRKVAVGGLAGALSVVLIWIVNAFLLPAGHHIPAETASAITTILTFIVSYFIPESPQ